LLEASFHSGILAWAPVTFSWSVPVVNFGGWGMTAIYVVALTFAIFVAAFRVRNWMLRDVEPSQTFYFFDRIESKRPHYSFGGSAKVDDLESFSGVDASSMANGGAKGALKRLIDITMSLVLIAALAPLLALTALAIKLETPGPVLYRQKRVGFGGEIFEVFKFRSMRTDAEKDGPQWARRDDDRITGVGRIIRKLRIDEIPQTINVFRGEMGFVGPRPERPEFVEVLEKKIPHYHSRHVVKPGITGWAQVKHEYTASVEGAREKLKYDLYYVKEFTTFLDILIIIMTVRVVLFGIGSR